VIAIVINDSAGRGRSAHDLPAVLERLGRAAEVSVVAQVVPPEAEAVVAVGGDGTVHHVLPQLAGRPLGIVPTGTGNDLAACFGLPVTPLAAADAIAEAWQRKTFRTADLVRLSTSDGREKLFAGVLAAGFDAIVNERGNRMRWPKGPRRYDLAIMLELARLRPRRYRLVVDGAPREIEAVLLAVGNVSMYGGGMRICPEADPTDGVLDLVWAEPISRTTLVRVKPRIYRGTHVNHPAVHQERLHRIRIDSPDIVCYADGEPMGPLPVELEVVPAALTLLG
jgi:diacylglycerol kinase (ATP)